MNDNADDFYFKMKIPYKETLELLREEDQDLLVFVKPTEPNIEFQSMITSQIGIWIRDIAGQ